MRKYLAGLSVLLLIATSMAQYVSVARNKGAGGGGGSSVTPAFVCSGTSSSLPVTCNATGTPTSGGKFVIFVQTFATAVPSGSNISCSNSGTNNTWGFESPSGTVDPNWSIAVMDATATNVSNNMQFSCNSTQTGRAFALNLLVMNAAGATAIDGQPLYLKAASSNASWTTSTLTPSVSGEGIMANILVETVSGTLTLSSSASWSQTSIVDPTAGGTGAGMVSYRGPYNSTTALSNTFTCTGGCGTDTPGTMIVAYK